eukprot:3934730-Rhodomonas_salina.1
MSTVKERERERRKRGDCSSGAAQQEVSRRGRDGKETDTEGGRGANEGVREQGSKGARRGEMMRWERAVYQRSATRREGTGTRWVCKGTESAVRGLTEDDHACDAGRSSASRVGRQLGAERSPFRARDIGGECALAPPIDISRHRQAAVAQEWSDNMKNTNNCGLTLTYQAQLTYQTHTRRYASSVPHSAQQHSLSQYRTCEHDGHQ